MPRIRVSGKAGEARCRQPSMGQPTRDTLRGTGLVNTLHIMNTAALPELHPLRPVAEDAVPHGRRSWEDVATKSRLADQPEAAPGVMDVNVRHHSTSHAASWRGRSLRALAEAVSKLTDKVGAKDSQQLRSQQARRMVSLIMA